MSNSQLGEIFGRYKGNPILTPARWPYEVGATLQRMIFLPLGA